MSTATELVKEIVQREESRAAGSWGHPERRLALLEICRAVDSIVISAGHQQDEVVELCRQGANKAIGLFLDESCKRQRTPVFPSNDQTFQWAHSVVQHCGRIATCEKLLDYEQAGLGEFSTQREELRFEVTPKYAGVEALEVEEFESLQGWVTDVRRPLLDQLDFVRPQVHERMRSLVYRWSDHYIGYAASPEVDAYYHQMGLLAAERMAGQDAFDDASSFGGLRFGFYKAAVSTLVGWTIKHINFALLLAEKYSDLRLQNLVTVTADIEKVISSLASALELTTDEAWQALSVLEVNIRNAKELCINGHAPPPLIRAAAEQFVTPISGFLIEPFQCMLRNLRAKFRQDWDRHVNEREALFREDLYRLFPQSWLVKIPKNVALKKGGRKVTDVDAVVVDERNGVAGLFQLKWQDGFGHSMRERSAKMRNFYREVGSWIEAVTEFLSGSTQEEINRILELPNSSRGFDCRLFIVGRYFAHFSGDTPPDHRAAWGVWPQVVRLTRNNHDPQNPIESLHSRLIADSPVGRKISLPASSFRLGNHVITMGAVER